MQIWHYWFIAGVLLFIGEIFTPAFVLGSLGIGAIVTGVAAWLGLSFTWQLVTMAISSFLVFLGVRPFVMKWLDKPSENSKLGVDALIGREVKVTEAIEGGSSAGRVQIGSESWRALSSDGRPYAVGALVSVEKIDGATAVVKLKEETEA